MSYHPQPGMYAHIFTTSHWAQTTSIHLLTRLVIVDGGRDALEIIRNATICACLTLIHKSSRLMPATRTPFPIYSFFCKPVSQQIARREAKTEVFWTFRPCFVCLPTNDPWESTSIMVIHNGLVYCDPWAPCLPRLSLFSPLHHLASQYFQNGESSIP